MADGTHKLPLSGLIYRVGMIARGEISTRVNEDEQLRELGIKPSCIGAIHAIGRLGPCSQKDVANSIGIDPSDLVGIIDILESAKYVIRQRDETDRRRQLLSLTKTGQQAQKRLRTLSQEAMEVVLETLNDKERENLRELLTRVVQSHTQMDAN